MRNYLAALIMLFFFPSVTLAGMQGNPTGPEPQLAFEEMEYDFGRIDERGGKVSHTYTFRNNTSHLVVIMRAATSCKCVNINYQKSPVAPNEEGYITVTYNPRKQQGVFYKAISIYANTTDELHIVIAKGEVIN